MTGGVLAANVISATGGEVTRQRWGGSVLEEARLHGDVRLMTVAPHAVAIEPAEGEPEVRPFTPELRPEDTVVRVVDRVDESTGGVSLADASVVVSGGRGVGSTEGFAPLEELAGLLGGVVGCSRAVTMAGWRPHTDQVGQTGTKISPELYIPCGISGATQHMAGCKGAKKLLAINSDPEAPIMASADYAVVGDVLEIVPAITAELRRVRAAS
jgi:electron transfer flavoprotein alpha subunit